MLTKKKSKDAQVREMVELTLTPFNDIYKTCCQIAKEWGNENIISLVTIDTTVDLAIKNAKKMKGDNIKEIRKNHILTLEHFKIYCHKAANEMGFKSIPKQLFKVAINQVKDAIKKGAGL